MNERFVVMRRRGIVCLVGGVLCLVVVIAYFALSFNRFFNRDEMLDLILVVFLPAIGFIGTLGFFWSGRSVHRGLFWGAILLYLLSFAVGALLYVVIGLNCCW